MIDKRITNGSIRNRFFSIPTIRNQIAQRQLTFIGKVVRNKDNQLPTQLMTAWCNNKRKRGAPLQNNKKNLAQNIRLLIPGAAKDGLLTSWVYFALDDGYWKHLISLLGNKPTKCSGPEPDADSPFPPRSLSQQNGNSSPPCTPPRHREIRVCFKNDIVYQDYGIVCRDTLALKPKPSVVRMANWNSWATDSA